MSKQHKKLKALCRSLTGWLELDLSALARDGKLPQAFELGGQIRFVESMICSGKHVVLSGDSGVGKTALVYELVRRSQSGAGAPPLREKAILQLSIRARRASLRKDHELLPDTQRLVDELIDHADIVVPFFKDLHLAYTYDLEPHFERLAAVFKGPILAEGDAETLATMFEYSAELERLLLSVSVLEPEGEVLERILARWADARTDPERRVGREARRAAIELVNRFSVRATMPRRAIDLLEQVVGVVTQRRPITELDVIDRFVQLEGVPRLLADPRVRCDPDRMQHELSAQIVEQDEAVQAVVHMISAVKTGLGNPHRPCGAFLFVGPTGVGKTHLARSVAQFLFGDRDKMIRLNMADFAAEKDAQVLFGEAHAYSLRARRGEVTVRLAGKPCAVLLLDEFEKAHARVRDRFLQLIDEGRFVNGLGEKISCRSLIVIATSNAGAEVYRNQPVGFSVGSARLEAELERRLLKHFRFELLNRFDRVVQFRPLSRAGVAELARRALKALEQRSGLSHRSIRVHATGDVIDWLTERGYDAQHGARFLQRSVEQNVTSALSRLLLKEQIAPGQTIEVYLDGQRVEARRLDAVKFVVRSATAPTAQLQH